MRNRITTSQSQHLLNRIAVSSDVCHGKPRIDGTRVMGLFVAGKSIEEITSDYYYPDITAEDVLACKQGLPEDSGSED